jgi:hypothetical protein
MVKRSSGITWRKNWTLADLSKGIRTGKDELLSRTPASAQLLCNLFKQNNEAKVRRSTKSTVVGKAKGMSYEDIKDERARRVTKGVLRKKLR